MRDEDSTVDFDSFVTAVQQQKLEEELVHEAAHSSAISTRTWQDYTDTSAE